MKLSTIVSALAAILLAMPVAASGGLETHYGSVVDLTGSGIAYVEASGSFAEPAYCPVPGVPSCSAYILELTEYSGSRVYLNIYLEQGDMVGLGLDLPYTSILVYPDTPIPLGLDDPSPVQVGQVVFYIVQDGVPNGTLGPALVEVEVQGPTTVTVPWTGGGYTGPADLEVYNISVAYSQAGYQGVLLALDYAPDPGVVLGLYVEDLLAAYQPSIVAGTPPPGTTRGETRAEVGAQDDGSMQAAGQAAPPASQPPTTGGEGSMILGLAVLASIVAGGAVAARRIAGKPRREKPPTPESIAGPVEPAAVSVEAETLAGGPGSTLRVPVRYSCPGGCLLSIDALGAPVAVEPRSVDVAGDGIAYFNVRLDPEARPGSYSLALTLDGRRAGSVEVSVVDDESRPDGLLEGYRLIRPLGSGGFSTVYLAERASDGRLVAVKVPRISFGETIASGLVETFRREAETWSRLRHENIVAVLDYGVKPLPYIVMEYMAGGSMRNRLSSGPLELGEVIRIAIAVGEALSYAHHLGVIHRDVKPENILFDDRGTPKLSDFGLAKVLLQASTSSAAGTFRGTLLYAAPEQIDPAGYGEPDWRTDVWQYGALLYEALTGRPPFTADTPMALMREIVETRPPPPSKLNPAVPGWLDEIVMKCLEKRKEDRWRSMDLIVEVLKSHISRGVFESDPQAGGGL